MADDPTTDDSSTDAPGADEPTGDEGTPAQATPTASAPRTGQSGFVDRRKGPRGPLPPGFVDRRRSNDPRQGQLSRERLGRMLPRDGWLLGVGIAAGLLLTDLVRAVLGSLQGLVVTLFIALFLSFAMEPAVQWLSRKGMRRGAGTMLVFVLMLAALAGFVAAMAPLVIDQVQNLVDNGPDVLRSLADQATRLPGNLGTSVSDWLLEQESELPNRLPDLAGSVGRGVARAGTTVLGGLLQVLTIALVTFYLVADGPKLRRVLLRRLPADRQREFLRTWEIAIGKTGGYVYSRVLTAFASAAFHIVAFTMIGIPYPAALGIWVGLLSSLIPVVGTYIAGALPVVIALAGGPADAVWVLAAIVIYQQVENYLVAPRITAATMELHPAVAFVSVLAGGALLGPVGALLALPAAAIVAALASTAGERHEVVSHGLVRPEPQQAVAEKADEVGGTPT